MHFRNLKKNENHAGGFRPPDDPIFDLIISKAPGPIKGITAMADLYLTSRGSLKQTTKQLLMIRSIATPNIRFIQTIKNV
ncbi:MAG: hypothetical protein CM15mP95_1570 [Alphaproteobacteria bacterium]|nr:MAG: hypothetical protein CM15mP95_1570 [Alphaproteobacteria bacterium]